MIFVNRIIFFKFIYLLLLGKNMTEETLKHLSIDGLFDLMLLSVKELLEAMDNNDEIGIRVKKKQVELLQRVILTRKLESSRR